VVRNPLPEAEPLPSPSPLSGEEERGSFIGLSNNIIFFYPPVLFVFGIAAVIQGFSGGD
jgi:hypothetical protein